MIRWTAAIITTLIISLLDYYFLKGSSWSTWQYFVATCLFSIHLQGADK